MLGRIKTTHAARSDNPQEHDLRRLVVPALLFVLVLMYQGPAFAQCPTSSMPSND